MNFKKNNKQRSFLISFSILVLMVTVQACNSKSSSPTKSAPTKQDAQGLFEKDGAVTAKFLNPAVTETLTDIKGMVYGTLPNQKFIFFDVVSNVLYDGIITAIAVTDVTGTADVYHDGVKVASAVAVTGNVTTSSSVSFSFAASGNFNAGTVTGLFISPTSTYDRTATNARIFADGALANANWRGAINMALINMSTTNFDVTSNNTYTLVSNKAGTRCDHSGIATPVSDKNIYTVTETLSTTMNCTITNSPNYTGLLSVVDSDAGGTDNEMWYAITNGSHSIFAILAQP